MHLCHELRMLTTQLDTRWPTIVNSFSAKEGSPARSQQQDISEEFVVIGISLLNVSGLLPCLARKCMSQRQGGHVTSWTLHFVGIVRDVFPNHANSLNIGYFMWHAGHPVLLRDT